MTSLVTSRRAFRCAASVFAAALALTLSASAALANSPWVLPKGATVLQAQFRHEAADREFLPDGRNLDLSLNGRYQAQSAELAVRQGIGAGFELSIQSVYKFISYDADPVFITGPVEGTDERVQISPVFSFSEQVQGFGDITLAARYNAVKWPVLVTPELEVRVPTGYAAPSGTFANDAPDLGPNATDGTLNIEDDLTLGDAQVDVTASILLGAFAPQTKTFGKANAGYRARFGGAGDQVVWGLKVGQSVGDHLVFFAETTGAETITTGDVIGLSFATDDPNTPAAGFPLERFEFIELRVDKSYVDVSMGALVRLDGLELIFSGGRILDGENIAELAFFNTGTVYRF